MLVGPVLSVLGVLALVVDAVVEVRRGHVPTAVRTASVLLLGAALLGMAARFWSVINA